jgi:hypothetical protein
LAASGGVMNDRADSRNTPSVAAMRGASRSMSKPSAKGRPCGRSASGGVLKMKPTAPASRVGGLANFHSRQLAPLTPASNGKLL